MISEWTNSFIFGIGVSMGTNIADWVAAIIFGVVFLATIYYWKRER